LKLQFDPNQPFQLDAVNAVADLFDGQPQSAPDYSVIRQYPADDLLSDIADRITGVGNQLAISQDRLRANLRAVQQRNEIDLVDDTAEPEAWDIVDEVTGTPRKCPHFSVEMETGTGKTYVYLRTIFELSHRYGFQKFVVVVPSVAIREGVLKNIEITADHFRALYNHPPFEHFVYDAKRVSRLRQFATGTTLQVLVINIDAFRRNFTGTDDERKSNVIYVERDTLSGRRPIEFVHAARPIVIIDEPQSVDATDKAQDAIRALNPLCTLRYSATHRSVYNLVYRLDPVRAYSLRLVKQIVVAGAEAHGGANTAFVRIDKVDYERGIKARVRIHAKGAVGPREKTVAVKQGSDLFALSGERPVYRDGFEVAEINAEPGGEFVRFANGLTLRLGEQTGGMRDDIWRAQIRHTLRQHVEKELQLQGRGIKVLSLFFIDRVANYRAYTEDGAPAAGKFAVAIEELLAEIANDPRFRELTWLREQPARLHNGYFAQDRKGVLKDTRGNTQDDDDVYDLIMKDKERLLSIDEPLRFIFSHSALREGWDNPNVFQICTLNETQSALKKRQEIGRGLRLPVDQNGARVFDESVNRLYVMANESYEDFAAALQREYEDDCGVTFGKLPATALAKLTRIVDGTEQAIGREGAEVIRSALISAGMMDHDGRILPAFQPGRAGFSLELPAPFGDLASAVIDLLGTYQMERHIRRQRDETTNRLRKEVLLTPEFVALWNRIKPRTSYRVEFDTEALVRRAADAVRASPRVVAPSVRVAAARIHISSAGVDAAPVNVAQDTPIYRRPSLPDILAYLQNETELTRGTLARILLGSGRLQDVFIDPQRFLDQVSAVISFERQRLLVDGIKYERLPVDSADAEWEVMLFRNEELVSYLNTLEVRHSVYERVVYDSEVERRFAEQLDAREDIKLFMKLPSWFTVDTPLGKYNPDWAVLKDDGRALYLVRETKGTKDFLKLRSSEADKVTCGLRHFTALDVDFAVAVSAAEV